MLGMWVWLFKAEWFSQSLEVTLHHIFEVLLGLPFLALAFCQTSIFAYNIPVFADVVVSTYPQIPVPLLCQFLQGLFFKGHLIQYCPLSCQKCLPVSSPSDWWICGIACCSLAIWDCVNLSMFWSTCGLVFSKWEIALFLFYCFQVAFVSCWFGIIFLLSFWVLFLDLFPSALESFLCFKLAFFNAL